MKTSLFKPWHAISGLGAVLLAHGLTISALVPTTSDPSMLTAAILLSSGLATVLVSLSIRTWSAARITFWMGGFRLFGALLTYVTRDSGSLDYRHFLVTLMILLAVLEFLAAATLRRSEQYARPLQLSALVGVMASAGLLYSYPVISDLKMSALLGFSMAMSGLAFLGLALANRRAYRAARAAIERVNPDVREEAAAA